ncbi:integrase catalytic domain-containing protein [Nephila pilipes]|uniref:Integrase catalytic domain-containing protein n=1 Tax=Nephila pilipes TaxID=299642 RepID=A0A8X6IY92_NEPPI|nr:integrase catalytic domain-containing protein [Nephila pilipes]
MAREQLKDPQLQDILAGSCPTSLVLQPLPVGQPPGTLHCDVSMDRIRPFVPKMFRREIFNNRHPLSHPKVSRRTRSEIGKFELPSSRLEHVHIDFVGPLPPSEGFRYFLTCVDRFSKWPEAFSLVEISAEAVTNASQPDEVPDSRQEKSRESSSRQETTTRSGRRVRFNPKYS